LRLTNPFAEIVALSASATRIQALTHPGRRTRTEIGLVLYLCHAYSPPSSSRPEDVISIYRSYDRGFTVRGSELWLHQPGLVEIYRARP